MKDKKLEEILLLVEDYIEKKRKAEIWRRGDWVKYSGPFFDGKEYKEAVRSLLSEWLIFGEKAREFEIAFPPFLGKERGILTNSGSSANLLMVAALTSRKKWMQKFSLPSGSGIITPVTCFPTTLNPIIQNGFEPVFCDIDLPSLNPDLDHVEKIIKTNNNIRGIMFAHVLGNPPDIERLLYLCDKYNLVFLEDACDALGSTYDGQKLGSFGLMSTCSFFPAHHMTLGEGGFVATSDARIERVLRSFRDWGRACYCNERKPGDVTEATACGNRFGNWLSDKELVYDHRYVFDEIGYNIKPLELQAAMGLEQIKKLPEMESARRENFKKLFDIFKPYEDFFHLPVATEKSDPCWFAFLLSAKENGKFQKQEFVDFLEKNKIQTRSYFTGNALLHPAYEHLAVGLDLKEEFPNAFYSVKNSFFLGTFIGLTQEKIDYIKEVVDGYFNHVA